MNLIKRAACWLTAFAALPFAAATQAQVQQWDLFAFPRRWGRFFL